jgi:ABC-type Fe3+/spermidine/putrescine transport system ATPase subunit
MSNLSIRGLVKSYGSAVAVKGIDLEIEEGELVVLLGPSGCGKTTTLRCVAGLEDVTDGTIAIGDRVVSQKGRALPPEKREIGMVFQSYAIWPHMTVTQNVSFGPKLKKLAKSEIDRRTDEAIELVGLNSYSTRHVSQLSGGQQQRVALARAMALEPRILLFDEPLSNLDAKLREKMRFELRQIQQRLGITSIYVTHDQQEAMVIADRIVLMNAGLIEQMGCPMDLYNKPLTRFAAEFVGLANIFRAETTGNEARIEGADVVLSHAPVPRGAVEVIIRPENVRISREPLTGPNAFHCKVKECHFLGNITDIVMVLGGVELRAQCSPAQAYAVDTDLWVELPPEFMIVLPRRVV